jgi:hypothetical protein
LKRFGGPGEIRASRPLPCHLGNINHLKTFWLETKDLARGGLDAGGRHGRPSSRSGLHADSETPRAGQFSSTRLSPVVFPKEHKIFEKPGIGDTNLVGDLQAGGDDCCEMTFVPANVAACRMSVRISSFETGAPQTRSSWNFESFTLLPKRCGCAGDLPPCSASVGNGESVLPLR